MLRVILCCVFYLHCLAYHADPGAEHLVMMTTTIAGSSQDGGSVFGNSMKGGVESAAFSASRSEGIIEQAGK